MPTIILLALSTTLSTAAVVFSVIALRARLIGPRHIAHMTLEYQEIVAQNEALAARIKRLNARVSMRMAREKLKDEPDAPAPLAHEQQPGETNDAWKQRMRVQLASGALNGRQ